MVANSGAKMIFQISFRKSILLAQKVYAEIRSQSSFQRSSLNQKRKTTKHQFSLTARTLDMWTFQAVYFHIIFARIVHYFVKYERLSSFISKGFIS
jgi:hypothetical protein